MEYPGPGLEIQKTAFSRPGPMESPVVQKTLKAPDRLPWTECVKILP
jgi:hypothetical protein